MAEKKLIAICQSGGDFVTSKDGSLSYKGGDAHAIDIDQGTKIDDLKSEIADIWHYNPASMIMKYFLPGNRKTLITISNDKDFKRMITFHDESVTTDIYISTKDITNNEVSNTPASRSSRTTVSERVIPVGGEGTTVTSEEPPLDNVPISSRPPSLPNTPIVNKHHKAIEWANTITGVNQRFANVHEFREALRKYSVAHGFAYKFKKNDSHRVTVKCKSEGCQWRIHASRLSTTQLFCIKKMNTTHTCDTSPNGSQARMNWVALIIKEKLRDSPGYKPKDIVTDIKRDYGFDLNYSQAWRAKEIAREKIQGSYKEAYNQLPNLCDKIMETNPGSLATFTTNEDSSFHRLFVSFHASLHGFLKGCRPLIFLDSTLLNMKYQGILLTATAPDGEDCAFPIAFAIVDDETDDNWHWFLVQLKAALSTSQPLTIVADTQKGLRESIPQVFENGYHGYCLRYLTETFKRDLKTQFSNEVKRLLSADFHTAACTTKLKEFQRSTDSIKEISVEAFNWIVQSKPEHWANVFFGGARYNHMTANFGEEFYRWMSEAHELPITQMVDVLRGKLMELIYERRVASSQWLTKLTPSMEQKLQNETLKARALTVLFAPGNTNTFEVRGETTETVDLDQWGCTCRGWHLTGLPCCHAIAVFEWVSRDPYDFCSKYFFTENYRLTYSESINPVPNLEIPTKKDTSQGNVVVSPPPTRRTAGRPKTQRFEDLDKRKLQCSKCKGFGHNKSSCKAV